MTFEEYQALARRSVAPGLSQRDRLAMTALGLVGEGGECSEIVKKHLFHEHALDPDELAKELGDVLWYLAMLADACELSLASIAERNVDKLRARYPDGFSATASRDRSGG